MTIRAHNQARVYLRCSSARQESSLATQLTWAIAAAAERGIRLHASLEDLDYMKTHRLSKYKDLYVDDAVSGTRSNRPGFDAMLQELKAERTAGRGDRDRDFGRDYRSHRNRSGTPCTVTHVNSGVLRKW